MATNDACAAPRRSHSSTTVAGRIRCERRSHGLLPADENHESFAAGEVKLCRVLPDPDPTPNNILAPDS